MTRENENIDELVKIMMFSDAETIALFEERVKTDVILYNTYKLLKQQVELNISLKRYKIRYEEVI